MRRIREILRLRTELCPNLSAIAAGAKVSCSTVRSYLGRAAAAGLDGANTEGLSEEALEAALFPPPAVVAGRLPDWAAVDQELRRNKHVTRQPVQITPQSVAKGLGAWSVDAAGASCRRSRAGRLRR